MPNKYHLPYTRESANYNVVGFSRKPLSVDSDGNFANILLLELKKCERYPSNGIEKPARTAMLLCLFPRQYLPMFSKSVPLKRRETITIWSRHVHSCIPQIGPGGRGTLCLNIARYARTRHTCVLYTYVYTHAVYDPSTKQYGCTHQVLSIILSMAIISIETIGYGVCVSSSRKVLARYGLALDRSRVSCIGVKSYRDRSLGLSKPKMSKT